MVTALSDDANRTTARSGWLPGGRRAGLGCTCFPHTRYGQQKDPKAQLRLYNNRNSLSLYGKVLLALATHCLGEAEQTAMLKQNIEQFLVVDQENDTAFLRDDTQSWSWYGNRIELNALYLS